MKEISVLNVIVNKSSDVVRHVFVKPLASDAEKSVILVNIPVFCDSNSIRKIFTDKFAQIESISFHSAVDKIGIDESTFDGEKLTPINGYRVAVVKFKTKAGLHSMKQFIESKDTLYLYGGSKPLTGLSRWRKCYNDSILDVELMKKQITNYMTQYDKKVEQEKKRAKAMEGVPDEDGWIKVTRHGKKPFLPNADYLDKKITQQMKQKKARTEIFPRQEKVKSEF